VEVFDGGKRWTRWWRDLVEGIASGGKYLVEALVELMEAKTLGGRVGGGIW
jgi:hypothetical protein